MLIVIDVALLAMYVLLPGVIIGWGNSWRSRRGTILRCAAALVAAWVWLVVAVALSADLELRLAESPAEMDRATYGDGPRMMGILLLGWAPSALLVTLWWALSPARMRAKGRRAA